MTTEPLAVPVPVAASMLGMGRSKLYELLGSKQLPFIKIGRSTRIPTKALHDFISARMKEAA